LVRIQSDDFSTLLTASYPSLAPLAIDVHARTASRLIRVTSATRRYWMRLERIEHRSLEMVELEAHLLAHLHSASASVAAPVPRADGTFATALSFEDHELAGFLCEEAAGHAVADPTPPQAHALGRALALLHQLGDARLARRRLVIDMDYLVREPLRHLATSVPTDWYEAHGIELLAARVATLVWGPLVGELPASFCHGDVHLENVYFNADTPILIDFGECGYAPSAHDLGCYWRKRILSGATGPSWKAEWRALLGGYATVRTLDQRELRAIPALAVLRAIRTMALPALPGCEPWGADWLRDRAYFQAHLELIDSLVSAFSSTIGHG
jgi:Ser/Thr protein kinase RdoA (MazF antagonist)